LTTDEPNHARDRIYGGGQPFGLTYSPTEDDRRRWRRIPAERTARAKKERSTDPTKDEE